MQSHYPASESPSRAPPGPGLGPGAGVPAAAPGTTAAPGAQDCCFPDWIPNFTSPMKEMEGECHTVLV